MNMGGRAYPVRHYPIAIRLRDLAFGNMVAMIVDTVNIRATCASALPTHSRSSWGPHNILIHSMYCAISSVWGHFGCFTRSAFRRTPSLNKSHFFSLVDAPGIVVFMVLLFPNSHVCTKSPLVHKTQMAIVFSEQCLRLAI